MKNITKTLEEIEKEKTHEFVKTSKLSDFLRIETHHRSIHGYRGRGSRYIDHSLEN